MIEYHKPDVVFLDIQLQDSTFFEMPEQLEFSIPKLVFIPYNENIAVKAFKHNVIDFILKPIDFNAMILAVYTVSKELKWSVHNKIRTLTILILYTQLISQMSILLLLFWIK